MSRAPAPRLGSRAPVGLVAVLLVACGAPATVERGPPLEALRARTEAARDAESRREALRGVSRARSRWPGDRGLRRLEYTLRAELGDWPEAFDLLAEIASGGGLAELDPEGVVRVVWASDQWSRWAELAVDDGGDGSARSRTMHALALIAAGSQDEDGARRRALEALSRQPGDPHLLTAVAAIDARRARWGTVLLFADRALAEAQRRGEAPPLGARTLLAIALATRGPERAPAAFTEARGDQLPRGRRAEGRFLLAHGRPAQAQRVLAEWMSRYPLDVETARLHARLREVVARVERETEGDR